FGSSRVMQLTGALVGVEGTTSFYNLGMSGATVEDYVGLWQVLRRQGKIPERAIFSIDPWILKAESKPVHPALAREVDAFAAGHGRWAVVDAARIGWSKAKELVSFEILRESARRMRRALRNSTAAGSGSGEDVIVPEGMVGDRQALRADGSLIYPGAF